MDIILVSATAFALSQLILSALLLFGQRPWTIQRWLFAILLLTIVGHLFVPYTADYTYHAYLVILSYGVPGLFWLFSTSLFDDHFRLRAWQMVLVAYTVMPAILALLFGWPDQGLRFWLAKGMPQVVEFALLGLTFIVVVRNWNVDLVESRRRLRLWFCSLNGVYIFLLILFQQVFPEADWLVFMTYIPVALMLLVTNAILLQYKQGILDEIHQPQNRLATLDLKEVGEESQNTDVKETIKPIAQSTLAMPKELQVDQDLIEELQQLVEDELAYQESGLTIGQLAHRLEVQEYRLRQTINAGLGYRNFNDFLNSYRIKEAARRLADPEKQELQVLTIALDTGFRSLSSFNKAFKSTFDLTPTEFRKQKFD